MNIDRTKFIDSLAMILDFLEVDLLGDVTNHNRGVALISIKIGKKLGLSDSDLSDLHVLGVMHDNGASSEAYYIKNEFSRAGLESAVSHCLLGEENIRMIPLLTPRENIIKYHHENSDGSGFFNLKENEIPMFSQIIHLADAIEIYYKENPNQRKVLEYVQSKKGTMFSEKLVDIFMEVQNAKAFWMGLKPEYIRQETFETVPGHLMPYDINWVFSVAEVVGKIVDSKTQFTGHHSRGLVKVAGEMADYYNFDKVKKAKFVISANLHDVGKLAVPNKIINKPAKLTEGEFEEVKKHPYLTKIMLTSVEGFEDIAAWAWQHHEKLNGTGYPYGITSKDISFEAQLMAVLDIYQALTEDRPYRKAMTHEKAITILKEMVLKGEVNGSIVEDIEKVLSK